MNRNSLSKVYFRNWQSFCLVVCVLSSCEYAVLEEEYTASPPDVFEAFWNEFDQYYGAMEAKLINWDSLGMVYRSRVSENTGNEELFTVFSEMLHLLNDGHASVQDNAGKYFRSWNRRNKSYFSDIYSQNLAQVGSMQRSIMKYYLQNEYESGDYSDWTFYYGLIPHEDFQVGYLVIPTFYISDFPRDLIDRAVDTFQHADAVIIDLRYNGGGTTESFIYTLNAFASEEKVFMQSKFKNGPGKDDFTRLLEHRTNPYGRNLSEKPIAILANSYTASSSEHFILGMKSQPGVMIVGDTTCGAFSSVSEKILPNGWQFRLGGQVIFNAESSLLTDDHGNYLEGIGIAPDVYCQDNYSQTIAGNDPVLDAALKKLAQK